MEADGVASPQHRQKYLAWADPVSGQPVRQHAGAAAPNPEVMERMAAIVAEYGAMAPPSPPRGPDGHAAVLEAPVPFAAGDRLPKTDTLD